MTSETNQIFPGEIKPGPYEAEIQRNGVASSFHDGVIYRHPGIVPLLDVGGEHFEMGLQYGVLMRPEILDTLAAYHRLIVWMAASAGAPVEAVDSQWRGFARKMIEKAPTRFYEEVKGISLGSGVPVESILMVAFGYDFAMAGGCTSVLLRGENGTVIHARNNDTSGFGGAELGRITAVVRRRAPGYHTTVQIDYPMLIGIESGYNDQGLAFTEETLALRQPNPDLFSLNFMVRMILEECSTLEELPAYFDRYPVLSGYGEIWSSQRQGTGWLVEQTPYGWTKKELQGDILWDFNTVYSPELKQYEVIEKTLRNDDDREAVAHAFPRKEQYTLQDGIDFIRATHDGAHDHINFGTRRGICNEGTQQAMVFDPLGKGIYLSWGELYCSRADFYYIHEDFSIPPDLFSPRVPLTEKMLKVSEVNFQLVQPAEKMDGHLRLAHEYPDDADFQFQVAIQAFTFHKKGLFIQYAEKAFQLQPDNAEYRLYAGIAAYWRGDKVDSVQRLESFAPHDLFVKEELYRLTVLEQVSSTPEEYHAALQDILTRVNAAQFYEEQIVPEILI